MKYFVDEHSIVRKIWGRADTVLFVFAGAAAEFALNKAVDWLYFTGKLPADPLARLFSTVTYAHKILFSTLDDANAAIDQINAIHKHVENARGAQIPDWAYRDVLYMLIDYSIRSHELLHKPLSTEEKAEVFKVFHRVGTRMQLKGLPESYPDWVISRAEHLEQNLEYGHFTADLFKQYRKHLGYARYHIMRQVQAIITPTMVKNMLGIKHSGVFRSVLMVYNLSATLPVSRMLRNALLPPTYKAQIQALDKA